MTIVFLLSRSVTHLLFPPFSAHRCARHPASRVAMPRRKKSGDDTLPSPLFFYWFSCSASPYKVR